MRRIGNATTTADRMRSDASIQKIIEELAISRQHATCGDMEPWEDCPAESQGTWRKLAELELFNNGKQRTR